MAISTGVYGHSGTGGSPASATVAFDSSSLSAANKPVLLAGLYTYKAGSTPDGVTSVTYNGVAMTRLGEIANTVDTTERVYLYGLAAPPCGNYNIVFTFQNSISAYEASYGMYQGADQASPFEVVGTGGNASASSHVITATSVTDNVWMVGFFRALNTYSNGSGTTMRDTYAGINHALADTNGPHTPPGSKSLTLSSSPANGWGGVSVFIKPHVDFAYNSRKILQAVNRASSY